MNKFRYTVCSIFLIWQSIVAPSNASNSSSGPLNSSSLSQIRFGIGLAGEYINSEAKFRIQSPVSLGINIQSNQAQTEKQFKVAPSLELGTTLANDYYLGLFISWRHVGGKNFSRSPMKGAYYFIHEYKLSQYTDVLLKPGYNITRRTLVYGLVGPSIANFSHTSYQYNSGPSVISKFGLDRKSVGLGLGFGLEYRVKDNYAFSCDYTHHFHRAVSKRSQLLSISEQVPILVPPFLAIQTSNGNITKKISPSYATIAARFTYYFNL